MASNSDDLEKALQQNLKLRRELGTKVAKARGSRTKDAPATPRDPPPKLTSAEARAMFWVLIGFLILAVIMSLAILVASGWISLPWIAMPPK